MTTIVFHINVLLAGGIEKVLIDLLRALDPAKYRMKLSVGYHLQELEVLKGSIPSYVEIIYLVDKPSLTFAKKKRIAGNLSIPGKLYNELVLSPLQRLLWKRRLAEVTKDADVVIDFDTTLAPYYKLLAGKKKIAYSHFSLAHYWQEHGNAGRRDKLAARLSHYDKVIMICDEMKEEAIKLYPQLKDKAVRLYNAFDQEKIKAAAEAPLALPGGVNKDNYFLSLGRLNESQKDVSTLIKAYAASVRKYDITEPLVIVGDGPDRASLETLVNEEGVAAQVFFTGFSHNPYPWIKHAKLFLFSSKNEGLPTVLIEALALAKPVVATACPTGVKEILMYGKAGKLLPVGDVAEMCEAIWELKDNEAMQAGYREHAQQVLKEFDITTVIKQFEDKVIN
ncbi:MAG: hypothetical protein BGO69_07065 [Bacteroidetes bacterium 46-16]|nr:MAG: hypothetical protein BGO69_07065 [Bacteroidetes bacterium 46-16]